MEKCVFISELRHNFFIESAIGHRVVQYEGEDIHVCVRGGRD